MKTLLGLMILLAITTTGCQQQPESPPQKIIIQTDEAPKAIGPYSQAVLVGETLHCSGQIALDPKTGKLVQDSIEAETRQVLENLGAVLRAAGMDYRNVVRATVYLSDIRHYQAVNQVYNEYFGDSKPARAAVQVAALPKGANVEISCIARKVQ